MKGIMRKRILAIAILMFCFIRVFPITALATDMINSYSAEINEQIEELFDQRKELVKDSEENEEAIAAIDEQLRELGVVFLNEQADNQKLQEVYGLTALSSSSSGITWTSRTYNQVYAGSVFSVEVIRGSPANENSDLFYSAGYTGSASSVQAGTGVAIQLTAEALVTGAVEFLLDDWAVVLSTGLTIWDICSGTAEAMSETTYVSMPSYQDMIVTTSEIKLAYVRPYGENEEYRLLGYYGSDVEFTVATQRWLRYTVDGEVYSEVYQNQYTATSTSPYFTDPAAEAAKNCYYYEKSGTHFDENYRVTYIDGTICGTTHRVALPYIYYD